MDSQKIEENLRQLQEHLDGLRKLLKPEPKFRVREVLFQGGVRAYQVRRYGTPYDRGAVAVVATVDVVKGDVEGAKKHADILAAYYNSLME